MKDSIKKLKRIFLNKKKPKENIKEAIIITTEAESLDEPLPQAEAHAIPTLKEEIIEASPIKEKKITNKQVNASLSGSPGKISATFIRLSPEFIRAKEDYNHNKTPSNKEILYEAMLAQASIKIAEIATLQKSLEDSNQVCPNLDKFMSKAKAYFAFSLGGNDTLLTTSALKKLNQLEEFIKDKVESPSISKAELKEKITRELLPTGLTEDEVQIFDKAHYNKLISIPTKLNNLNIIFDQEANPQIKLPRRNSFSHAIAPYKG